MIVPPPPCPAPPLVLPRGGGGGVTWSTQKKICGSLCCCTGDCVVRHCHFYPLYSWKDILLLFTEMELESTTMFTPGTSVMFIRSTGEPVLALVVGYSDHGDGYRRISCERFPRGRAGGPSLGNRPPGDSGGPSSLGWGRTRCVTLHPAMGGFLLSTGSNLSIVPQKSFFHSVFCFRNHSDHPLILDM